MKRRISHHFFFPVLLVVFIIASLYGCQTDSIQKDSKTLSMSPAQYLENHMYQEAAWEYLKAGDSTAAKNAIGLLREVFESDYIEFEPLGTRINASETYLLTFANDVKGVFKIENSDTLGKIYFMTRRRTK